MTRRLVFYGNCQIQVLAQAYELFAVPHTAEKITYVAAAAPPSDAARAAIAAADIVIDQITPMGAQPPVTGAPSGAGRVRVPVVDGSFLWPYSGARHPESLKRYPSYHPFPMELGDSWLLKCLARGATPDEAVSAYMALDIAKAAHLDRRFEIAMEWQRAREADTRFRFAPLIERHFRTERLFRTPYHLETRLFRHMLLTLLDDLGTNSKVRDVADIYAVKSLYGGSDLPVHPGTAGHFGLAWADAGTKYLFWREAVLTFEAYAHRFVRCEAYPDIERATDAVMKSQPEAHRLVAAALAAVPDSPWALHAAAILKVRETHFAAALPLLHRALAQHEFLPGARATLHECLLGLGRTEEATEALLQEVRHAPFRIPHQMRLAQHFRSLGRIADARNVLDVVLSLNPNHPPAHRLGQALSRAVARPSP